MTKQKWNSNVPLSLVEAFKKAPMTRSAAIALSIRNAESDPHLLARAFQLRLSHPHEENDANICYTRDFMTETRIKALSKMVKLPGEEIIRLCMEAYIHRL